MSRLLFAMNLCDDGRFHPQLLLPFGCSLCGIDKQLGATMRYLFRLVFVKTGYSRVRAAR
jgi:hypothetical protein